MNASTLATAIAALAFTLSACTPGIDSFLRKPDPSRQEAPAAHSSASAPSHKIPLYTYQVVKSWPHPAWSFTEGLDFKNGLIVESSGGQNPALLLVRPDSGQVMESLNLGDETAAEGVTAFRQQVYLLTSSGTGRIFDGRDTLREQGEFPMGGEGWGLTHDAALLIMSNGSNVLKFIDPKTFHTFGTISVTCNSVPIKNLNALQYIKGEIYANIWKTDYIVRIDPYSGRITGLIDLKGLLPPGERSLDPDAVLNGIAYDDVHDRLIVTGKKWPLYFEIRLKEITAGDPDLPDAVRPFLSCSE